MVKSFKRQKASKLIVRNYNKKLTNHNCNWNCSLQKKIKQRFLLPKNNSPNIKLTFLPLTISIKW
jgi:hypothetical protein